MSTPESKAKRKNQAWLEVHMPGHVRISPRGGPFGQAGVSDWLICWMGVFIALEVKSDDGDLTPLQLHFLKRVQAAGGIGAVIRGHDVKRLEAVRLLAFTKSKVTS